MLEERALLLDELQKRMEYRFSDSSLLETALTHSSYVKGDGKGGVHNERLEYLGDAVLELCVTEQLYMRHPGWPEGRLTRARAAIVCEASLFALARARLSLEEFILLSRGEELGGGRSKPSIVSDALEAVIGALYLDGGLDAARNFVIRLAGDALNSIEGRGRDEKTALQEYAQRNHLGAVTYRLKSECGPDHKKEFVMEVCIGGALTGEGAGFSKQEAGRMAARAAMRAVKAMKRSDEE